LTLIHSWIVHEVKVYQVSYPLVIKLLENNREIKFKMVLHCIMEKTNIKTGEVQSHPKAFHSEIGINLVGTNTDEIYSAMMKTILERLATFQRSGSNWIFSSVVNLDIHTVKYKPLHVYVSLWR